MSSAIKMNEDELTDPIFDMQRYFVHDWRWAAGERRHSRQQGHSSCPWTLPSAHRRSDGTFPLLGHFSRSSR